MEKRQVDSPIFFALPQSSSYYVYPEQTDCQSYKTVSEKYPTTSADARRCAMYCSHMDNGRMQQLHSSTESLAGSSSDTESVSQIDDVHLQNVIPNQQNDCKILQNSPKTSTSKVDVQVFYPSKETSDCQSFGPIGEKLENKKEIVLKVDNPNLKKGSANNPHIKKFHYSSKLSASKSYVPDADVRLKTRCRMRVLFPSNMMELESQKSSSDAKAMSQNDDPQLKDVLPSSQQNCKILQNSPKPSTSKVHVPVIHLSKEVSDRRIFLPSTEELAPPRICYNTQTDVTVMRNSQDYLKDDDPGLQKSSPLKQNRRIFGYSSKPTTSKGYVCSFQKSTETCVILQPNTGESVPEESSCQLEIGDSSPVDETAVQNFRSDELEANESSQKVEYSRKQWTVIILAWLTTAVGLGVYVYLLALAYSGYTDVFKQRHVYIVVCLISNICLLSAIYFNYKIRKYLS